MDPLINTPFNVTSRSSVEGAGGGACEGVPAPESCPAGYVRTMGAGRCSRNWRAIGPPLSGRRTKERPTIQAC